MSGATLLNWRAGGRHCGTVCFEAALRLAELDGRHWEPHAGELAHLLREA
jgi:hypothetical protein